MSNRRVGLWTVMGIITVQSVWAQDAPRFALETSPRARCATRPALAPYLAAVFGRDPVVDAVDARSWRVEVTEVGGALLRVSVRLRTSPDSPAVPLQALRAPSAHCSALLASVASTLRDHLVPPRPAPAVLTRAMLIDRTRDAVVPTAQVTARETRVVDRELLPPVVPPAMPPPPRRIALQVTLDGYAAHDLMPSISAGVRLGLRLRTNPRRDAGLVAAIALRGDIPSLARYAQGTLESWALGGDLSLCARWRFLDGCGLAHLGVSTSQIDGGEPRATTRWFVGAQLGATIPVTGPLGVRASVELLASPTRTHQEIAGRAVWTSPLLSFTGGLGAVVDFL